MAILSNHVYKETPPKQSKADRNTLSPQQLEKIRLPLQLQKKNTKKSVLSKRLYFPLFQLDARERIKRARQFVTHGK